MVQNLTLCTAATPSPVAMNGEERLWCRSLVSIWPQSTSERFADGTVMRERLGPSRGPIVSRIIGRDHA